MKILSKIVSIPKTVITRCALDQAECVENTQPLPQRVKVCSVSGSAGGQALLELMPVRLKLDLNLEIKIRPDPGSTFKRISQHPA